MVYPIGLPSTQDGSGNWQGMTPEGMQRAIGSSYMNEGIVPGPIPFKVSGTNGWAYSITACTVVGYTSTSKRLGVLIPIEASSIPVSAAPAGSSRTDTIYVETLTGVVRVAEGISAPGSAVVLAVRELPAGAANTKAAVTSGDTDYAIPSGASLGRLLHWDGTGISSWTETLPTQRFSGRFVLPTDRIIRIEQIATFTTKDDATDLPYYVAFTYNIDGTTWVKRAYFQADPTRQTRTVAISIELPAGAHTLTVDTHVRTFNGSQSGSPFVWVSESFDTALEMSLWDMGVAL